MRIFFVLVSATFASDICPSSIQGREWGRIRIATHINDENTLRRENPKLAEAIIDQVLPAVRNFWESAMRVRRVSGRLRVHRDCEGFNGDCFTEAASTCASHGGYGVKIPDRFFSSQQAVRAGAYGRVHPELIPGGAGVAADIILMVSVDAKGNCSPSHDSSGIIAEAFSCRHDACGRPTMAVIHICPRGVDPHSASSVTTLYDTLAHEMTHAFGFTADSYHKMRLPSGAPRIPIHARRTVKYTCEIDPSTNRLRVQWDVRGNQESSNTYSYTFPTGIISRVRTRDGVGSASYGCHKCPLDPSKIYTNEDIQTCLENIGHCSFAISTPRVVRTVRDFFDCPTLSGAELDNRSKTPSCRFFDSHWKQRILGDEYMTPATTGGAQFISPITFAFLEDLGWYRMDYTKTTPLIQGAHWGYKEGCDFVNKPCINEFGNPVQTVSDKFFCNGRNPHPVCSANALHKVTCDSTTRKDHIPELYRYPVNGKNSRYDFCPVYYSKQDSFCYSGSSPDWDGEVLGESSRCLDQLPAGKTHMRGMCFQIHCVDTSQDTESFSSDTSDDSDSTDTSSISESFSNDDETFDVGDDMYHGAYYVSYMARDKTLIRIPTPCEVHGQTIQYDGGSIICSSPQLICSKHIAPHMGLNPFGNPEGAVKVGADAQRPIIDGENGQKTIKSANIFTSIYFFLTCSILVSLA